MKLQEIRKIAVNKGLKPGTMKKADLIRSIQEAEGNPVCFGTERAGSCGEDECLWKSDCQ